MKVTARCEREDSWWVITIPEHPGVFTQARRLDQVPALVADAVGLWLERGADDIAVEIDVVGFESERNAWHAAMAQRAEALEAANAATVASAAAAIALIDDGLTVRDVGAILGVSHQRVAQLAKLGVHARKGTVLSGAFVTSKAGIPKGRPVPKTAQKRRASR